MAAHASVKFKCQVSIDSNAVILKKRNLEPGGAAIQQLQRDIQRLSEPYTPRDTGQLIKMQNLNPHTELITYMVWYAIYAYYKPMNFKGAPMRGRYWISRMWIDHKQEILTNVARIVGGEVR